MNDLRSANSRLSRRVLMGLGVLATIAIVGPIVSYVADVAEARRELRVRLSSETDLHADSLALHLGLLQAELNRIANRPEVDPKDDTTDPERLLLNLSHRHSALFKRGVALLNLDGTPVWAEPADEFAQGGPIAASHWFQQVLAGQSTVIDAYPSGGEVLVMAVPIVRSGALVGVAAGLIDISRWGLGGALGDSLLIVTPAGRVLWPRRAPAWALEMQAQLAHLATDPTAEPALAKAHVWASAAITGTPHALIHRIDERAAMKPIRSKLLHQLLFIAFIQLAIVALFTLYLRRSYEGFRTVEAWVHAQDRMAALGQAASLIAHEVKNALNGLKAATGLLATGGDTAVASQSMRPLVDRLAHLSSSLLSFAKPPSPRPTDVHLDALVREAAAGLASLPEGEDVELSVDTIPIRVQADGPLLVTAIDNLIRNALEAGAVAHDLGKVDRATVRVRLWSQGNEALFEVTDNAGGPPPGFEQALFQPFVTSKPKGIGLGLAMAKQAVESQGGRVEFDRLPAGSRFRIRLPMTAPSGANTGEGEDR